jgi:DNA-binding transcriptional ArsR family regulator
MAVDNLSLTFGALADPTRRAILARLATGEASVTELAKPFDMTLPAISKHLKVLERAGLVVRGRDAQWRPCRIQARPLREADSWIERYRDIWEQRFDRLDAHLGELQKRGRTR